MAGEVAVSVAVDSVTEFEHGLHFTVQDSGAGIPADKQALIFDAFSQADGSMTRIYGGTGLGLAIAAQLVRQMGGRIWVESVVGKGSTFHFTARFGVAELHGNLAQTDQTFAALERATAEIYSALATFIPAGVS